MARNKGGSVMAIDSYQKDVLRTADKNSPDWLLQCACKLHEEAGEVAGIVYKIRFQGHKLDARTLRKLVEELGDCLYYLTAIVLHIGADLFTVIWENTKKRQARYPDGFDPERSRRRGRG
jgi:NTP pyrophosphatase (non-canonical NTP hydrolase)